jgi:hypothetical protein
MPIKMPFMPPMGGGQGKAPAGIGLLDISKLGRGQDYQDEFMEAAKGFSESWRELLKKDKRF